MAANIIGTRMMPELAAEWPCTTGVRSKSAVHARRAARPTSSSERAPHADVAVVYRILMTDKIRLTQFSAKSG